MNKPTLFRTCLGALIGSGLLLAGCGQKGPLYMPDTGGAVVTRPAGAAQSNPQQPTQPSQTASPETAPQPSTQTPADTTTKPESNKKSPPK
jgi:predicted small lipoprotein YifL